MYMINDSGPLGREGDPAVFDFDSANTLRAEECERKPNLYVAQAMRVGILTLLLCLLFNEIGVFRVDKTVIRVCVGVGVVCCLGPQVIANDYDLSTDPKSKYVVLVCTCILCFIFSLALFIFSAPLALLPMLMAVQYNSLRMSRLGIACSCVCVVLAPPMGCVLGLWQGDFMEFLLSMAMRGEVTAEVLRALPASQSVLQVLLYISFPWLLTVLMMGKLIMLATYKGIDNIDNQVKILRLNRIDALTGLYNSHIYDQYLKSPVGNESVGVLFFDVDGLKRANDEVGHEHGDLLLRRCAESLHGLFDDACHGFRIGGDEFLVVVETEDPAVLERKAAQWRQDIERINLENRTRHPGLVCHMSMGSAFGPKYDLSTLILRADSRMYQEKKVYHETVAPR